MKPIRFFAGPGHVWVGEKLVEEVAGEPLSIVIQSNTDELLLVEWDLSVLVTPSGESARIIHRGVEFVQALQKQMPSTLAPNAKLTDVVVCWPTP